VRWKTNRVSHSVSRFVMETKCYHFPPTVLFVCLCVCVNERAGWTWLAVFSYDIMLVLFFFRLVLELVVR